MAPFWLRSGWSFNGPSYNRSVDDRDAAVQANDSFYRALADLALVHPGGEVVVGWNRVRLSWERMFALTRWLRVIPTLVDVHQRLPPHPDGWRMIVHHASAAPVTVTQPFSGTVQ